MGFKDTPTGNWRVFGPEEGSGHPLLFLHGVTSRWQDFLPLIPALSSNRRIYAWDFPGHGCSTKRLKRYRVIDYVSEVDWVLKQLAEPAVIYGHSLGGMVATAVAAAFPEAVAALILEDPPFETMGSRIHNRNLHSYFCGLQRFAASDRPVGELARELAEIPFGLPGGKESSRLGDVRDAAALRFTARALKQLDPAVLSPVVQGEWLKGYALDEIARRVQCPTLLLQADELAGGMLSDEDAALIEKSVSDCTRIRFRNGGHRLHWTLTESVLHAVICFLESLPDEERHEGMDSLWHGGVVK